MIQPIVNLLENGIAQISLLAWPLTILLVSLVGFDVIKRARETGRFPIWEAVGGAVGIIIAWYIISDPETVACWIRGMMGAEWACPG